MEILMHRDLTFFFSSDSKEARDQLHRAFGAKFYYLTIVHRFDNFFETFGNQNFSYSFMSWTTKVILRTVWISLFSLSFDFLISLITDFTERDWFRRADSRKIQNSKISFEKINTSALPLFLAIFFSKKPNIRRHAIIYTNYFWQY